jgi:hypothetical protein
MTFPILDLEDSDCGPEKGIEVFPVLLPSDRIGELAAKQVHSQDAEYIKKILSDRSAK